ncbi:ATP-binding protein [Magnetococcales bacterium HHB-1]
MITTTAKKRNHDVNYLLEFQQMINTLLRFSHQPIKFENLLRASLSLLFSVSWLPLRHNGAIFLMDEKSNSLKLIAKIGLPDTLKENPFNYNDKNCDGNLKEKRNHTLCPDDLSKTEEMGPDSNQFLVPIRTQKHNLGVLTLFLNKTLAMDSQEAQALETFGHTLAGIIQQRRTENILQEALKDLKNSVDDLEKERTYSDGILQSMADPLLIISSAGQIIRINHKQLFGYHHTELLHEPITTLFPHDNYLKKEKLHTLLQQIGSIPNMETTIMGKQKEKIPVFVSGSVMQRLFQEDNHLILVIKDISEHKQIQKELREKNAQLIHAGRLTALGEMLTGVAHELNQPLSIIRMGNESLQNAGNDGSLTLEELLETTAIIMEQVDRANNLLMNMRAFARGEEEAPPQPTTLITPLKKATAFFKQQFLSHNIDLKINTPETLPAVLIHASQFEQIVVNLLSNARHAVEKRYEKQIKPPKKITISLQHKEAEILLTVQDNGHGMSTEEKERCLEPFFTTKEIGQGTGLGLHIIHGIITKARGHLHIESQEGLGTQFHVTLPVWEQTP